MNNLLRNIKPSALLLPAASFLLIGAMFFYVPKQTNPVPSEVTLVRYLPPETEQDTRMEYYIELLRLALEKTVETHGAYKMEPAPNSMTQVEAMKHLMKGELVDVLHSMTNKGRERVARPVRIPLDKGLIGMRLLMINKDDEARFRAITTEDALSKISLGQGADWPDTEILKFNKMKVVTSSDYHSLFGMLAERKIEAFPRAVFEIWEELEVHKTHAFAVAPGIVISYPSAMYFFVKQSNFALAERLETGLRRAIADGSFDKLFNKFMRPYLEKAVLKDRIRIKMKNPLLPEETPLGDKQLWYM